MTVVDTIEELNALFKYIEDRKTLLIPIYCSNTLHPVHDKICLIYIYTEDAVERIVPFNHTEQITSFSEHLPRFLELDSIFIHEKKNWLLKNGNNNSVDIKTMWWYTYDEAYQDALYYTDAHHYFWNRMKTVEYVNSIIPIMKHLEMCQKIRKYAWPMIMNATINDDVIRYDSIVPKVFSEIEKVGLPVQNFVYPHQVINNRIHSQYHYQTTTGRPSNAFGGFNFAAMNKDDGTRDMIVSSKGSLVEFDFDSYHVRLIAKLIDYELPTTSVHEYLGKFYFDKDKLTEKEYDESKQLTFKLIYGFIPREFLEIEFFKKVDSFTLNLWAKYKKQGYVKTPFFKRHLKINDDRQTPNKLFNYYLQAIEMEYSVFKIHQVQELIKNKNIDLILYTYDSLLFDIELNDSLQENILLIKKSLEENDFPVKVSYSNIYSKMKRIELQ